jgi:hypothetical protein
MEMTFNPVHADDRDIAPLPSGRLPVRPPDVSPGPAAARHQGARPARGEPARRCDREREQQAGRGLRRLRRRLVGRAFSASMCSAPGSRLAGGTRSGRSSRR